MSDDSQHAVSIRNAVKDFILEEFLQGADADEVSSDTELMTSGILDSLATVRLVAFLEEQYGIRIEPHETSVDHIGTLDSIAELVQRKRGGSA